MHADGTESTYHVYPDGRITDTEGNLITTGGLSELRIYITNYVTIQKVKQNINGVERIFTIQYDKVTEDATGEVICETGG